MDRDASRVIIAMIKRPGRWLVGLLILGAVLAWIVWSGSQGRPGESGSQIGVGIQAPDFDLTTLDGRPVRRSDFGDRPLVLNFFASWCDPCREEAPVVKALADGASGNGYTVLGVAIQDEREAVARFMKADGLIFPVALDLDGRVARVYRVLGPPATFFIDARGVIRHIVLGPLTLEQVREGLGKAGVGVPADGGEVASLPPEPLAAGAAGLALAAGLGLLSFFSPCVLPLLPAYLGYITGLSAGELSRSGGGRRRWGQVFGRTCAFASGLILVFVALGASASLVGWYLDAYRPWLSRAAGLVVLILGLQMLGLLRLPVLYREFRLDLSHSDRKPFGSFLKAAILGAAFALGWTPCVGPALGGILALASQEQTVGRGALLLLVYGLGMGAPFVLAGLTADRLLGALAGMRRYTGLVSQLSGVLLSGMGLLLLAGKLGAFGLWLNRIF